MIQWRLKWTLKASLILGCLVVMLASAVGCSLNGSEEAACVQPQLSVSPEQAAPGQTFRVSGDYFFEGCNDSAVNGEEPPDEPPQENIQISLRQGDRTWHLTTVDADSADTIDVNVEVPVEAQPGNATVVAHNTSTRPVEVPFRIISPA